ncbi:hypothetical protein JCM11641_001402 [Rhodosporidiobolus odoratus]
MSTTFPVAEKAGASSHASSDQDLTLRATERLDGGKVEAGGGLDMEKQQRPDTAKQGNKIVAAPLSKIVPAGVSFILIFWVCALWLYGSLYKSSEKTHNLGIAIADFDGGSIGAALLSAVNAVNGQRTSPSFHILPSNSTSPKDLQHLVFTGKYWGGIYASAGATDRFNAAIGSDATAANSYNPAEALTYTGLEVRYNTVWSGFVLTNINKILLSATSIFNRETVAPLLTSGTSFSGAAAAALVNPIASTYVNLTPFSFATRIVLNTIGFVFPSLFCFFFLVSVNTIGTLTGWYRTLTFTQHLKWRVIVGLAWTLLASLSVIGWALCFDEKYEIEAKNFFAVWAVMWVYIMITYDLFDIATAYVPPQFLSHIVVFYIIAVSVTAVLFPIELMNKFFRLQYAFPAHATWSVMITIFGRGAVNTLKRDLPILMAWLIVCKVGLVLSLKRRAKPGVVLAQAKVKP